MWTLRTDAGALRRDPSAPQLAAALARLDGRATTFLRLDRATGESLWAAGGDGGHHLVVFMRSEGEQTSATLCDPTRRGADVTLTVEGTASDFPARFGIGRALLLRVFATFLQDGGFPDDATWDRLRTGEIRRPGDAPRTPIDVNDISRTHAEIDALEQALARREASGKRGGYARLYVDRPPCAACLGGALALAIRAAHLDSLELTFPAPALPPPVRDPAPWQAAYLTGNIIIHAEGPAVELEQRDRSTENR